MSHVILSSSNLRLVTPKCQSFHLPLKFSFFFQLLGLHLSVMKVSRQFTCNQYLMKCGVWAMSINCYCTVLDTSCQIYPSEYAYLGNSVNRAESVSANCRNYPPSQDQSIYPEYYIHCDGTQLILADSNLGQEQYRSSEYYRWGVGSHGQVLFIFPTSVSLTTITLYYYSDNFQGIPRLRFYAVPDDFEVWDATATSYSRVDVAAVPPGGEPAGRRNISINVNFNIKKVLMYKFSSSFLFAVSEVEFSICSRK